MSLVRTDVQGQRVEQADVRFRQQKGVFQRLARAFDHVRRVELKERPHRQPRAHTSAKAFGGLGAERFVAGAEGGFLHFRMKKDQAVQAKAPADNG